jgi:hypothetical protein
VDALIQGINSAVFIVIISEGLWAPENIWVLWRGEKLLTLRRNEPGLPRHLGRSLVVIFIEQGVCLVLFIEQGVCLVVIFIEQGVCLVVIFIEQGVCLVVIFIE